MDKWTNCMTSHSLLHGVVLHARCPYCCLCHRTDCLHWFRNWQNGRIKDWHDVLFTDESCFCIEFADGGAWSWRHWCWMFDDACVLERDRWGGIVYGIHTQPVFLDGSPHEQAQCYIYQVLRPLFDQRLGFQIRQDNTHANSARIAQ